MNTEEQGRAERGEKNDSVVRKSEQPLGFHTIDIVNFVSGNQVRTNAVLRGHVSEMFW